MASNSSLVRLFGFPATVIHSDTTVLDRWLWLKKRLIAQSSRGKLLDVGCGAGAFTIGSSLLGYSSLGLSWDEKNQGLGAERAAICNAPNAKFIICDARKLDEHTEWYEQFDTVVCLECIEHILDDRKLMRDLSRCLKPGGVLLLTTPSAAYRPITKGDNGPWSEIEDGGHVRKGYTPEDFQELCKQADLKLEEVSYCSGFFSQKITAIWRLLFPVSRMLAWLTLLPLRLLPLIADPVATKALGWPYYSICLKAVKS